MSEPDEDGVAPPVHPTASTAARREIVRLQLPTWLRTLGTGAWYLVGIAVLVAIGLVLLTLVTPVAIPLVIAAVLAAIFVPVVDRLERWRVPRWLGATLLLLVLLTVAVAVVVAVVRVVVDQGDQIRSDLEAGLDAAGEQVDPDGEPTGARIVAVVQGATRVLLAGMLGSVVFSVTALLVGVVLGVFMLLFLLKDWEAISRWTARNMGLPARLGEAVLGGTVRAFRGYALGLTQLGVANAVVVGLGALLLDVPFVGTIAVVTFLASYVPFFGAFVAGAFAVVLAWGAHGLPTALAMLAIVLLANNTIQNLFEPFAFGRSLRLHPLAVLVATTAGTLLFGLMGAILAAPLTSASLNAVRLLRDAGVFDEDAGARDETEPAEASEPSAAGT